MKNNLSNVRIMSKVSNVHYAPKKKFNSNHFASESYNNKMQCIFYQIEWLNILNKIINLKFNIEKKIIISNSLK